MVEVDVEENGDLWMQRGDRAIRLVTLDHEPAGTGSRVAAELRHVGSDEERRVETQFVEAERDHRRCRRLAVSAGDDDGAPLVDELGEQVCAR